MILIRDLNLTWANKPIFKDINVTFAADQKIGVVGRNGAGKSTLLKVIAGLVKPDSGTITLDGTKKIAYMPQEMVLLSEKTIFDEVFSVFDHYLVLEKRKHEVESLLQGGSGDAIALADEYSTLSERLGYWDVIELRLKTETILKGLGFLDISKTVNTLSVGWKMRVVLAKLLLQDADFYLFDEPTNHLDLVTKEWFFNFLQTSGCGFLLVSHDRYYLERGCTKIFELELGRGTLYHGNFNYYLDQKEQYRKAQEIAFERQQKEIARKEATIERFRASASKAKMAQSMIKQLDNIERIELEPVLPVVRFSFPPVIRSGNTVLSIKNLSYSLPERVLFKNVNAEIVRGEKVALVAPNGTGKTTLFNLLVGKYPLQTGTVTLGHNVEVAFFEQDQTRALTATNTILQEVTNSCPKVSEGSIRSLLGSFLFSGDDVNKKISILSGGEKNRVAMVKVLLAKANFLILDEPTNHLDIYAQEVLLQALQQYEGTILIVSHDHAFIQKLATRILELVPTGLYSYPGTYEDYCEQKEKNNIKPISSAEPSVADILKPSDSDISYNAKDLFALRKKISALESKITRLEQERALLVKSFEKHAYGTPDYNNAEKRFKEIERLIISHTAEWEQLQNSLNV